MKSTSFTLLLIASLVSTDAHAASSAVDLLTRFNIITGNYSINGGETEGAVFVAGEFNPSSTAQMGFNAGQAASDTDFTLWLNNGLAVGVTTSTQIQSGSVISRTPVDANDFMLNGNAPDDPTIVTGQSAWDSALNSELGVNSASEATVILTDASNFWSTLGSNSSVSVGNGSVTFTSTPQTVGGSLVSVFNIGATELDGTISSFNLDLAGAETVLINVAGSSVNVAKNFIGDFIGHETQVIFNFYEANVVNLSTETHGSFLAPIATVNQQGSNINGSVAAAVFNQTAEVHHYNFDGNLPIPEPSTVLLSLLGATIGLMHRRRWKI